MKKSFPLLASLVLPLFIAMAAQSCAGGETDLGDGTGGDDGSGGGGPSGSGGRTNTGSGGTPATGSGGAPVVGSGGRQGGGSGGRAATGSGGAPVVPGTGGAPVVGGTGGAASAGACSTPSTFAMNGYGMSGTWKGYAYTGTFGTMASVMPVCGAAGACFMAAGTQLCASGMVGGDAASGALLGWNLNQGVMAPNPEMTVATGGAGVTVNVSGAPATARVAVQTMGGMEFCALMPAGGSGTIPWTMFNSMCWNPSAGMMMPAGSMISKVNILVPGQAGQPQTFCMCIVNISGG